MHTLMHTHTNISIHLSDKMNIIVCFNNRSNNYMCGLVKQLLSASCIVIYVSYVSILTEQYMLCFISRMAVRERLVSSVLFYDPVNTRDYILLIKYFLFQTCLPRQLCVILAIADFHMSHC